MTHATFNIDTAMQKIEEAVRPFPQAALFELADAGYTTPFAQLVACIISIRTRDEVMLPTARALFETANTPQQISELSVAEIDELIGACSFHTRKAGQIHAIATTLATEYDNQLPCDRKLLLSFKGVGPKCANLALALGCGEPFIGVDVHVHRITNRWGYVATGTPEQTLDALQEILPRRHWIDINRLLVPFGKHICTGRRPRCSTCPVQETCARVGVTDSRSH